MPRMTYRNAVFGACALGVCALAIVTIWAPSRLRVRVYASGLSSPVAFVQDPLARDVQFVVEQAGRIRVVRGGTVLGTDFLNLRAAVLAGGERGLLGLAFAPDAASGRFYVNFTDRSGDTVVARFERSSDPLVANPASRFDLRFGGPGGAAAIAQPFANHNGGHLAFGPDGYLYIGLGDGGPAMIRNIARRIRRRCSARCCASTSTCPTRTRTAIRCRRPIRLSVAGRLRRGRKSGRLACVIRGASASMIPRAAARARWSSAMSGRTRSKRSTTSRPVVAAATTAGGTARAPTTTSRRARRPFSRSSIRSTSTAAPWDNP